MMMLRKTRLFTQQVKRVPHLINNNNSFQIQHYAKLIRGGNQYQPSENEEEQVLIQQQRAEAKPIPKTWKDTSPAIQAVTDFKSLQERDRNTSITGRIYSSAEPTVGLKKLIEQFPILNNNIEQELTRAVTHVSFGSGKVATNETMSFMGKRVLDLFITESVLQKYPLCGHVNMRTLKLIRAIYTNESHLAYIVADQNWKMDAGETMRVYGWEQFKWEKRKQLIANVVYSIVAAVYSTMGPSAARQFIQTSILTDIPTNILQKLIQLKQPVTVFEDIIGAQLQTIPRVIEEQQQGFTCSYFVNLELVGYATADDPSKARKLAAMNGLFQMTGKLPQH